MNKTAQITNIIQKRQPLVGKIAEVQKNLNSLTLILASLETCRKHLLEKVDDPAITGRLREIDLSKIDLNIKAELYTLDKLKIRFSRPTLNIGVIGRARQGKSRLLQSLTGLTKDEIPDGSGQHCTGVRSTIQHHSDLETYGEVWFYTEHTFLDEIIAPYYEYLKLGIKPISIEDFASKPLPVLTSEVNRAENQAKYEYLRRYHENLGKYRHLLQTPSPRRINLKEIREYVAQDNSIGERVYFNYLAVREVKIFCKFPQADVGKIALVDLPGLGDTGIGDDKRMVKTIGEDVDAVLFVKMPKSNGDFWADVDVQLYDTAYGALNDLPLSLWSFMVLNELDNPSNSQICNLLKEDIHKKSINVANCVIANCADPQAATAKVLEPMLNYLTDSIADLDRQYASSCQERLLQIQATITSELNKAQKALGQPHQLAESAKFAELFEDLWKDLSSGLEKLLKELSDHIDKQDIDFKKSVNDAMQKCKSDTKIPTNLQDIEKRRDAEGSYEIAYNKYLNEVRAHLTQHFLSLDEGLQKSLERVKSQVTNVLISKGKLGGITEARGADFLRSIAQILPDEILAGQASRLKFGFEILSNFELSYRGMIQHRIRKCLDGLTPDKNNLKLSKSPNAEQISKNLLVLHGEAVYQCQTVLGELLTEPSQAAFAIVEEFLDRVLRAENVQIEWRIFLEQERSSICPGEFELLGERSKLRQDWLNRIEQAIKVNQNDFFQFVNK